MEKSGKKYIKVAEITRAIATNLEMRNILYYSDHKNNYFWA
jgi:hypothetical protein